MEQVDLSLDREPRPGPLLSYAEAFVRVLGEQGYTARSIEPHARVAAELLEWLERQHLPISVLDEQRIEEFTGCDRGRAGSEKLGRARCFLKHLRQSGVVASSVAKEQGPAEQLCADYQRYLLGERGLCARSVAAYARTARRFLRERFGEQGPVALEQIAPGDLIAFMCRCAQAHSLESAKLMGSYLRSFLRFLRWRGALPVNLEGAVPSVACWRLSALPRWIGAEALEQVLRSCERQSATGRRDYAILLLLARLGLRAIEVARLTLEDVIWCAAEINVTGKGGRPEKLPLAQDVGEAVVNYLRHGRPRCATRHLFVRAQAPRRGLTSAAVSGIAHRRLLAAGIELPPRAGAHLLRHSLATDLLRHGASLDEIAQVLRHRHIHTTEIYAKVDLHRLHLLAEPWPGGAS